MDNSKIKVFKFIIFFIFVSLFCFLIFSNLNFIDDTERNIPSSKELSEFSNISSKSSVNSYNVKDIPDKELATIYYNHFKKLIINNPDEAYNKVRNKKDVTGYSFDNFRTNLENNYYSNKVKEYKIWKNKDKSIYKIVNTDNQVITFYVDAVLKYEVELSL